MRQLFRLRAIALALRLFRLRAIALALRLFRLRAIALALRLFRLGGIALALRLRRPVDLEPGLLNDIQRDVQKIAFLQFQPDFSARETLKTASKNLLLIQRDAGLDSGQLSLEASVVTFLDQFPVQTRRGNFQRV